MSKLTGLDAVLLLTLMVRALADPDGANLDRIQIVKGCLDGQGKLREKIYDVACANQRSTKSV